MKFHCLFLLLFIPQSGLFSQKALFSEFNYRNFSPTHVSAWISDLAAPENADSANRHTFYAAARHGGVWKTNNNGITFHCITDTLPTTSMGAVEVAPSNPYVVWVGTGEASSARSAHRGYGVYKSEDGGKHFQCMGLENTQHIARIVIHPEDEDVVYVASMGSLFSPNPDRGVFRTTDGGITWEKVLYIDENTGVIDLVINRKDPGILYAATYEKYRYPWHLEAGGPESGIYRTSNAGDTWTRLSGGLPGDNVGRIGVDIYRSNPDIMYAVVENLNPKPGYKPDQEEKTFDHMRDPYFDRLIGGEVYRSEDAGRNWVKMNHDTVDVGSKAAYSFNQIMIDPMDDRNIYINNVSLQSSRDGGRTWDGIDWETSERFRSMFGDVRSLWINPRDSRHIMAGSDGGVNVTYDQGLTTRCHHHIPLGEVYNVEVDDANPYHIYAGLQDHEGWKAPSNGWRGSVGEEDWSLVGMWDGMYIRVDHENNRWLYTTTQFGAHQRVDQLLGERKDIQPEAGEGLPPYRYTWNTPLIISPHNSRILYTGGQMLLRSVDRGDRWQEISPDLTSNDVAKIEGRGHIMYCTFSSISESPLTPGIIWVGTDDGKVWITRNHGAAWTELTANLHDAKTPRERYVSRVFASHHDEGMGYVVKSGFRNDDFSPYIYRSGDFGQTWEKISHGLPDQPVSAFWEDDFNPDLLFAGTDRGVYLSLNGGESWFPFRNNMPNVPVKDLLDIEPKPVLNYSQQAFWGNHGPFQDNLYRTPNEENGLHIYYYLGKDYKALDGEKVLLEILDSEGKSIHQSEGLTTPGIHKMVWNTTEANPGFYTVVLKAGEETLQKKAEVLKRLTWPAGNKKVHSADAIY
jgi:photosystem II stability/assembly factor-like uncharacterized protein